MTPSELFKSWLTWLEDLVKSGGLSEFLATMTATAISVVIALVLSFVINSLSRYLVRWSMTKVVKKIFVRRSEKWEVALRRRLVARRGGHIVGAIAMYALLPFALSEYPTIALIVGNVLEGYLLLVVIRVITSVLRAASDVMRGEDVGAGVPASIALQALEWGVVVVGSILIIAAVFDKSVTVLLSGMAGMTAVTMLVFRDSLLGFVAGIQLSGNEMVAVGDWIEVPQYGVDGNVIEIGMATVKVQNFDKTISTIPSYALLSESFRNWQGMKESGGRRIMRSISVDMECARFLTADEIEKLTSVNLLRDYLTEKQAEIEGYNNYHRVADSHSINGRRLTNIGVFRTYLTRYLETHPKIRIDMTLLVRQKPPSAEGLPIEVIAFSSEQAWRRFEEVQADIFDHIIAVMPEFGLKTFQHPSEYPKTSRIEAD